MSLRKILISVSVCLAVAVSFAIYLAYKIPALEIDGQELKVINEKLSLLLTPKGCYQEFGVKWETNGNFSYNPPGPFAFKTFQIEKFDITEYDQKRDYAYFHFRVKTGSGHLLEKRVPIFFDHVAKECYLDFELIADSAN